MNHYLLTVACNYNTTRILCITSHKAKYLPRGFSEVKMRCKVPELPAFPAASAGGQCATKSSWPKEPPFADPRKNWTAAADCVRSYGRSRPGRCVWNRSTFCVQVLPGRCVWKRSKFCVQVLPGRCVWKRSTFCVQVLPGRCVWKRSTFCVQVLPPSLKSRHQRIRNRWDRAYSCLNFVTKHKKVVRLTFIRFSDETWHLDALYADCYICRQSVPTK
jgi:hypothetical protein